MSKTIKDRARAALLAYDEEGVFDCTTLPLIIADHEGRRDEAYWDWPGMSAGNMRRICEDMVQEGILKVYREVKGKYRWNWYSKVSPSK